MKKTFDVFLSAEFADLLESLDAKFEKAGFRVPDLAPDRVNSGRSVPAQTRKAIEKSRVFVAFLTNSPRASNELLFAYESGADVICVLLEKLDGIDDDDHEVAKIVQKSLVYDFHAQTNAPTDKQLNFLFVGLVNILGYQNRLVSLTIIESKPRKPKEVKVRKGGSPLYWRLAKQDKQARKPKPKRRRFKKKRRRKPHRRGLRLEWIKHKEATKKKKWKTKTPRKKAKASAEMQRAIKVDVLDYNSTIPSDVKPRRKRRVRSKISRKGARSLRIAKSQKEARLKPQVRVDVEAETEADATPSLDSRDYDLTSSFQVLSSRLLIDKFESTELSAARAVMVSPTEALCLSHERETLLKLTLDSTPSLKEVRSDAWTGKQPYSIRPFQRKLLVSFRDESSLCQTSLNLRKSKYLKLDAMNALTRIWDVAFDPDTKRTYVLDTAVKNVLVFDERFNFIRNLEPAEQQRVVAFGSSVPTSSSKAIKYWPRDMKLVSPNRLFVVDTCTCVYDFNKYKLLDVSDGGNCIRIFDTRRLSVVKSIRHKSMLRPLGLLVDARGNILTTANFVDNYKRISPYQYLFCFNQLGRILQVTCLEIDLRSRGISDMTFVSPTSLLFCCLGSGLLLCNFDQETSSAQKTPSGN